MKSILVALLALSATAAPADAATLKVPQQFATIQAAVDAAGPGDVIVVAPGVYDENVLVEDGDLTLRGNGATIDGHGSTCVALNTVSRVVVEGLTLRNAGSAAALQVGLSIDVIVRDCVVRDSGAAGIVMGLCQNVIVEDNKVMDVAGAGISVASNHVLVRGNLVKRAGAGISVIGSFNTVEDNRIRSVEAAGIALGNGSTDTSNCVIADNSTKDTDDGILVLTATSIALLGNAVAAARDEGMDFQTFTSAVVAENSVKVSDEDGIEFSSGCTDCLVERNTVVTSGDDGFDVNDSVDLLFRANTVKKAGGSGFFTDADDGVYIDNKATGSGDFDLENAGVDNVFIANVFKTISPIV